MKHVKSACFRLAGASTTLMLLTIAPVPTGLGKAAAQTVATGDPTVEAVFEPVW